MDALITAAGTPTPDDPLYAYTQGDPKALLDVAGKPMAQWVLDALDQAESIDRLVIIGPDSLECLTCGKEIRRLPDTGSLLSNIVTGLKYIQELSPSQSHAVLMSSDVPAITGAMIDQRVQQAEDPATDIDYIVVERSSMESRFPDARRSFVRLKDIEVCGGDVGVMRVSVSSQEGIWEQLIAARKNPFRQAALIGFDTFLMALARRITLQDAERRVSKRLGIAGRVHVSPYPELAMDVDKPHHLELLRHDLASRSGHRQ